MSSPDSLQFPNRGRKRLWFPVRLDEPEPVQVILPVDTVRADTGVVRTFEQSDLPARGERVVRVFPSASRPWEILFLQMLAHRRQKWAPAKGDGILVLEGALPAVSA